MKRVAAIHDLSCYAKSSLTVVLPAMSALGVEVAPLPTALLSTQTDGFEQYHYQDLTDSMEAVTAHWRTLALAFDAVYSGFLGSQRQIAVVADFIAWQRSIGAPLVIVDPVLGDDGAPYGPVSPALVHHMHTLVALADVVTPNPTEAALLLGERYQADVGPKMATQWARRISDTGPTKVALTGVPDGDGGTVVCYDRTTDAVDLCHTRYAPVSYPGSGDLFASILCALMMRGTPFAQAAEASSLLVSQAVFNSWNAAVEHRHGVAVESIMADLVRQGEALLP